jgi:hypothetical protein
MSKKPKLERFVTPIGTAQYPHLNKPDTKFNPDGEYKVNLEIDNPDAVATLVSFLDEQMAESFGKAKEENQGKKIKQADAPYTLDENTGKLTVRFKLKAKVTPKNGEAFEQKVALFDAKGTPMVSAPNVGGGSKIKVSYEVMPFYTALIGAGISLRVRAVQVIELVEYTGSAGAGAYGFGEEDGYEADTTAPNNEFNDETQESAKDF